jgi:hypothetical protein
MPFGAESSLAEFSVDVDSMEMLVSEVVEDTGGFAAQPVKMDVQVSTLIKVVKNFFIKIPHIKSRCNINNRE